MVIALSEHLGWMVLLCLIALALFWRLPMRNNVHQHGQAQRALVTESGRWAPVATGHDDNHEAWQIDAGSRLLPFALYVVMVSELSGRRSSFWIFPQQTSALSYRRLARIIFRQGIL